jgi:hypothetical protein
MVLPVPMAKSVDVRLIEVCAKHAFMQRIIYITHVARNHHTYLMLK